MPTKKTTKTTAKKTAPKKEEFAVIETGGKQYVVSVGDVLEVEKLEGDFKAGDTVEFENVLLVDDGKDATIGTPYIKGAKVMAKFVEASKGEKLTILRYKSKSNRDRKIGHRQKYSKVSIEALK